MLQRVVQNCLLMSLLVAAGSALHAATPLTTIAYTTANSPYIQNFDGMITAFPMNAENSTQSPTGPNNIQDLTASPILAPASLNGWSITNQATPDRPRFFVENGDRSILPCGNYAFYKYGTGLHPDVSLGTAAYTGGNMVADTFPRMGAIFVNNTGVTLNSVVIQYQLEQWYVGQVPHAHVVPFEYSVGATDINTVGSGTPFARVNPLDLVSIRFGSVARLDGNAPGNFTSKGAQFALTWPPGAQLVIRWTDFWEGNNQPDKLAVDDFILTASQSAPILNVTGMTPAPGSVQTSVVQSIVISYRSNLNAVSVNTNTVTLQSGGPDGILDTADDTFLTPVITLVNGNQIKVDLPAQNRVTQQYRVKTLASAAAAPNSTTFIQDTSGLNLDGEFGGTFPSGNGSAGGDFSATFEVDLFQTTVAGSANPGTLVYGTGGNITLSATVSALQPVNAGTLTFQLTRNGVNVGSAMTSPVANGTGSVSYPLSAGASTGTYVVNVSYSGTGQLAASSDSSAQITITPAALTVVANNANRLYGAADPIFSGTLTGPKNGDAISAIYASSALQTSPKGTYAIVPSLVDPGGKLSNYTVTSTNGTLTITAAPLSAVAAPASRVYGAVNPAITGTFSGAQAGDAISATFTTSATASSPAGMYTILVTLVDPGNRLSNYTVTKSNSTLTVTQAPLSVLAASATRPYATANPVFTGTLFGVVNGDAITAQYSCSATPASPAGQYPITPVLVDPGNKLGNYTVNSNQGTLVVTKSAIIVTIDPVTRPYGTENPVLTGTITGVQSGDGISVSYSANATATSPVGKYNIVPALLDPNNKLGNYTVTAPNGVLTVTKAALVATVADASKTYGDANPDLNTTISGVKNGDLITATAGTLAAVGSAPGPYEIAVSLNDPGNKLPNYDVTINPGTLTINPATLTVVVDDASRIYGTADPVFTGTLSGIVNGDSLTATYAPETTANSSAGTYPIYATITDPDGRLGNYVLITTAGTFTILKAIPALTWSAPAGIIAGVPLSGEQLNATASDPISNAALTGSFVYTPAAGTVLAPGAGQVLSVMFLPTDSTDYESVTFATTIDVGQATAVSITSALTASAQKNSSFTYTITAVGSAPMIFGADGLPAGLSLTGSTIAGTPTVTGLYYVTLNVTNYLGTDMEILVLTVSSTEQNHAPVIGSPPTVSANPATTAVPVIFSAQASDADGDALVYAWDFGDGTTGLGASVSKTYSAAGVYTVTLTVMDGVATDTQSINVVIHDTAGTETFSVDKASVVFNFVKDKKDRLSITGRLPFTSGFAPDGKTVRVLIGRLDFTGVLNTRASTPGNEFSLKGRITASTKYAISLKNENLFTALEDLGFSRTAGNPMLKFPVIVVIDGVSHFTRSLLKYEVRSNRRGPLSGNASGPIPTPLH